MMIHVLLVVAFVLILLQQWQISYLRDKCAYFTKVIDRYGGSWNDDNYEEKGKT